MSGYSCEEDDLSREVSGRGFVWFSSPMIFFCDGMMEESREW